MLNRQVIKLSSVTIHRKASIQLEFCSWTQQGWMSQAVDMFVEEQNGTLRQWSMKSLDTCPSYLTDVMFSPLYTVGNHFSHTPGTFAQRLYLMQSSKYRGLENSPRP